MDTGNQEDMKLYEKAEIDPDIHSDFDIDGIKSYHLWDTILIGEK